MSLSVCGGDRLGQEKGQAVVWIPSPARAPARVSCTEKTCNVISTQTTFKVLPSSGILTKYDMLESQRIVLVIFASK